MIPATRPCSESIWWRCNGLNVRSRIPSKVHGMCGSGVIGIVSPLVSRDADDDAQDMIGLSRAYKSSGSNNAGVTSHNGNDDEGETMTGKTAKP